MIASAGPAQQVLAADEGGGGALQGRDPAGDS